MNQSTDIRLMSVAEGIDSDSQAQYLHSSDNSSENRNYIQENTGLFYE